MKAIWIRIGEEVEIVRELNKDRYVIKAKNTYDLCIGVENKPVLTTARKIDLDIIKED